METNKGTVIYTDNFQIESEKKRLQKNIEILNSNYEKVKAIGFDAEICFYASNYNRDKENLRKAIKDRLLKKDYYSKSEINSHIREIEKRFFYNEFDENGMQLENEKYTEGKTKNLKQINNDTIRGNDINKLLQFDEEKEVFEVIPDYQKYIEVLFTYTCKNERQERVLQLIGEIVETARKIKETVPYFKLTEESNYKRNEVYKLIHSIQ